MYYVLLEGLVVNSAIRSLQAETKTSTTTTVKPGAAETVIGDIWKLFVDNFNRNRKKIFLLSAHQLATSFHFEAS